MTVLVTGATGFLGGRLVRQLLAEGMTVRCLARRSADLDSLRADAEAAGLPGRLEVREGNLSRIEEESDLADGCAVVYHVAAELRGGTASMFLTNVVATRGLLASAGRAGVGRFVLVSSLGVYGTGHLRPGDVLDESCPLDPEPHRRDPYTYSKVAQEQVAWDAHHRGVVPLAVVRPAVIYGPGREAITGRVGLRLGNFLIQMGGRHRLPYVYVDNCARGILLAGTVADIEGLAFNLVDDELPTGRQILRRHRRSVGRIRTMPIPGPAIQPLSQLCEWYHERSRGQLPAVLTRYKSGAQWKPLRYSNARAKARLAWTPEIGLPEGLDRTFAWLQQQAWDRRAASETTI